MYDRDKLENLEGLAFRVLIDVLVDSWENDEHDKYRLFKN